MKIFDISWPITQNSTEYKNKGTIRFEYVGDSIQESIVRISSHTGTHVDAPAHFIKNGRTVEQIPLERLCGLARVIDCTEKENSITENDLLKHEIQSDEIILLKTKNSDLDFEAPFTSKFVYLEASGASFLLQKGIKAVGIDYLGIEREQPNHETHITLLSKNIPIIEGLRLAHIVPGLYTCICLPLAVQGLEAAPARVILLIH